MNPRFPEPPAAGGKLFHTGLKHLRKALVSYLLAGSCLCCFPFVVHAQNIVVNGSFEGGTYSYDLPEIFPDGWVNSSPTPRELSKVNVDSAVDPATDLGPEDGTHYVRFQSPSTNGTTDCLYQPLNTIPGQQYTVSFWVAITSTSVGNYSGLRPVWDESGANETELGTNQFYFSPTNTGPVPYHMFSFIVTASTNLTYLYFHAVDVNGSILLDNVSVVPLVANAPVAQADSYSTAEDTLLTVTAPGVLANDSDPLGNPITAVLATTTAHGTLNLTADGSFTYQPATNFVGSDSFTYTASDGQLSSQPAAVTITVTPVNHPPVAQADNYTTPEDALLTVTTPGVLGNDSDPDGNPITAVLAATTAHGTLNLAADGSFTYQPATNFVGSDNFTYTASDGQLTSAPATVSLTVTAVYHAPDAPSFASVTFANNQFSFSITGTASSNYVVQATSDLSVASPNWISLITNAAPFTFVETNVDVFPTRYYRALVAP